MAGDVRQTLIDASRTVEECDEIIGRVERAVGFDFVENATYFARRVLPALDAAWHAVRPFCLGA